MDPPSQMELERLLVCRKQIPIVLARVEGEKAAHYPKCGDDRPLRETPRQAARVRTL
jgi:hypothetical protein